VQFSTLKRNKKIKALFMWWSIFGEWALKAGTGSFFLYSAVYVQWQDKGEHSCVLKR